MRKSSFMIIWLLLGISHSGFAKSKRFISLDAAIGLAKQHSHTLKLRENAREKLEHQYRQALGKALPQVSVESSLKHALEAPKMGPITTMQKYDTSYGITLSQAIYTFGALSNAIDAADIALDLETHVRNATANEIAYITKITYYSVLFAEKRLAIAKDSLANARENLAILKNLYSSGRPPEGDIIRLNADIAQRIPSVTSAESELKIAQKRLKILLGLNLSENIALSTPLRERTAAPNYKAVMDNLYKGQPELEAKKQSIQLQGKLAEIQNSTVMPAIGAFYTWSRSNPSEDRFFDTNVDMTTSIVGINFTWNIWDGGSTRAAYRSALMAQKDAEVELVQARENLQIEAEVAIDEIRSLQETLESDRRAVDLANRSFSLTQRRLRSGKASVSELNLGEQQLTQTKLSEATHIFKLNEAFARLEKLVVSTNATGGKR